MKPITKAEAERAIRWFQGIMGLADWKIELDLQDGPPEWCVVDDRGRYCGRADAKPETKLALVWVSNLRSLETASKYDVRLDPLCILFHELLHVDCGDAGIQGEDTRAGEFVVMRLAQVLAWAYRQGMKP